MSEHKTRSSDSSFYDAVCTVCGGTDASWDDTLNHPCEGSEQKAQIAAAMRKLRRARDAHEEAYYELERLLKKLRA